MCVRVCVCVSGCVCVCVGGGGGAIVYDLLFNLYSTDYINVGNNNSVTYSVADPENSWGRPGPYPPGGGSREAICPYPPPPRDSQIKIKYISFYFWGQKIFTNMFIKRYCPPPPPLGF